MIYKKVNIKYTDGSYENYNSVHAIDWSCERMIIYHDSSVAYVPMKFVKEMIIKEE